MAFVRKQHLPELEQINYKHKKFDQRKRSRDEQQEESSMDLVTASTSSTASPPKVQRLSDSPLTISSESNNSDCEILDVGDIYSDNISATTSAPTPTPPPQKRRRLNTVPTTVFDVTSSSSTSSSPTPTAATTSRTPALWPRFTSTPNVVMSPPPPPSSASPALSTSATAAILPKISDETLQIICKYHGNMVRQFPKKERTPKDQERRNKNTIACRMSRRVKKLEHIAIEEQYKEFSAQHLEIVEASMRASAYLNHLMMQMAAVEDGTTDQQMLLDLDQSMLSKTTTRVLRDKKPFSIDYLTGNDSSN